ncbi:hypothetical protein SLEP1_g10032 [Rubroshorea leprosula]|uniref:Uncharacterized protein n=1 Tax=Rubroshorea leprosula TaxID=152421 RepID=A0AAV5IFC4_9ROSI|nr:hypothetical protein SLEP1_g10032 [Rubroshorea leprosula]
MGNVTSSITTILGCFGTGVPHNIFLVHTFPQLRVRYMFRWLIGIVLHSFEHYLVSRKQNFF